MIVIVPGDRAGIQLLNFSSAYRYLVKKAIHIEEKLFPVRHPVWCFKPAQLFVNDHSLPVKDIHCLKTAAEVSISPGIVAVTDRLVNTDIPYCHFFNRLSIVRADKWSGNYFIREVGHFVRSYVLKRLPRMGCSHIDNLPCTF